jgi:hypothetical protein
MEVSAAFAVVVLPNGRIAGTTRPGGGFGLPGGKVEQGESPVQAAVREAEEEGWDVGGKAHVVHDQLVDGKLVIWISFDRAERRAEWKERGRVEPVELTLAELEASGMGNDVVARKLRRANKMLPLLRGAARAAGKNVDDAKLIAAAAVCIGIYDHETQSWIVKPDTSRFGMTEYVPANWPPSETRWRQ